MRVTFGAMHRNAEAGGRYAPDGIPASGLDRRVGFVRPLEPHQLHGLFVERDARDLIAQLVDLIHDVEAASLFVLGHLGVASDAIDQLSPGIAQRREPRTHGCA